MPKTFHAKDGSFQVVSDKGFPNGKDFPVVVQHNGGSAGNIVAHYETEQEANSAAEQFRYMYEVAREEGFYLIGTSFKHNDGREVDISNAFDTDRSTDNFRRLLNGRTL